MASKTYKNVLDDGYTTYHDDGSTSTSYRNVLDDGITTFHSDGSTSTSYRNVLDDGVTTFHSDGSTSTSYRNVLDDGVTTFHSDGSTSTSYRNVLDDGITTYHNGGRNPGYAATPSTGASYGGYSSSSGSGGFRKTKTDSFIFGLAGVVDVLAGIFVIAAKIAKITYSVPLILGISLVATLIFFFMTSFTDEGIDAYALPIITNLITGLVAVTVYYSHLGYNAGNAYNAQRIFIIYLWGTLGGAVVCGILGAICKRIFRKY